MTLLGWSAVPLFLKHFSHSIDAWTANGWRYGFSALLWAPVVVFGLARRSLPRGIWLAAIMPAAFNTLGQTAFAWAFYKIDPGLLTFGLRLQIVFVGIGAYLLFPSERRVIRNPGYLIGAGLVLAGTIGTIFLGPARQSAEPAVGAPPTSFDHALGVGLAVASGLLFAGYALAVRRNMQGVSSLTAFAVISQYTAAAMVVLMLALGIDHGAGAWGLASGQFGLLLLSSVIGIALGHVFYYASIARLGVAVSSGVVQLQPFIVTAASAVLFEERMTPVQLVCGVIAIGGAATMLTVQHRLARADRAAKRLEEMEGEQA
jgi:drug/metabolite transporter (DMT)-like permease